MGTGTEKPKTLTTLSLERQSKDLVPLLCYYPPATLCPHSSCTYSFACFTSYIVFYAFFTVIHSTVSRERTTYAACYSTQRVEEGRLTRLSRRAGRRDPMYYNYQLDSSTNTERSVSSAALLRPTACLARSPSCCLRVLEGFLRPRYQNRRKEYVPANCPNSQPANRQQSQQSRSVSKKGEN